MIISLTTAGINTVADILANAQRLEAIRWFENDLFTQSWFVNASVAAIIILSLLFIAVTYNGYKKQKKVDNKLFLKYADEKGLSPRERQIMMDIALREKLKQIESILTLADVFDRAATKIVRYTFASQGIEKSKLMRIELLVIREKLGFHKRVVKKNQSITNKPGSRQIPEGKKVYLTDIQTGSFNNIESFVKENNELELTLETHNLPPVESGLDVCVRYYFGASVWEFDSTVLKCDGDILVLNHNDDVRFVNRRRFYRVPVNEPAYIAAFPFARDFIENNSEDIQQLENTDISMTKQWGPPEFVSAELTELAGPGLKIVTPLEVKVGDRVVVILKLGDKVRSRESASKKLIEDIAIVRHVEAVENGFSIAVEMVGISDSEVSHLVRATNTASLKERLEQSITKPKNPLVTTETGHRNKKWEIMSETIIG